MKKKFRTTVVSLITILVAFLLVFMVKQYNSKTDLYSNQITTKQLESNIDRNSDYYAYYYQPNCFHCMRVSPYLIPMGESMGAFAPVDLAKYKDGWSKFKIKETPTVVYYQNGEEVKRIEGEHTKKEYNDFFNN